VCIFWWVWYSLVHFYHLLTLNSNCVFPVFLWVIFMNVSCFTEVSAYHGSSVIITRALLEGGTREWFQPLHLYIMGPTHLHVLYTTNPRISLQLRQLHSLTLSSSISMKRFPEMLKQTWTAPTIHQILTLPHSVSSQQPQNLKISCEVNEPLDWWWKNNKDRLNMPGNQKGLNRNVLPNFHGSY
jgi:hypothetical protein